MNVGQVIACAREWVELYGRHTPGFCGAHRYQNAAVANKALALVRERGAKGFVVQADVARPKEISRMVELIQAEFGTPDIFLG